MNYTGHALGADTELSVEREGVRIGERFVDYAEITAIRPVNHRVILESGAGPIEISMLGFAFDGFWEELNGCFAKRSLEALYVEEPELMLTEGEYAIPQERGRGRIALYPDAVCVLPYTTRSVRIPLCYTDEIRHEGYAIHFLMRGGRAYSVSKMGYDTHPFAERAMRAAELTKKKRAQALKAAALSAPFTHKGLFRTLSPEQYWNAALGDGVCALELFTGEDAATYLYRFTEPQEKFLRKLEEACEAMGTHREIIRLTDEELRQKPLCRMSLERMEAVRFLRARSAGRLIHAGDHEKRLRAFLDSGESS